MPQRKKQKSSKNNTAPNAATGTSNDVGGNEWDDKQDGTARPARGTLKEFVEHFKDQHYHVVEMRILTVCSFAVFLKLFMSEALTKYDEDIITYSALIFIVLSMLVVMASTWMDFFPGRLVEVKLRPSEAQGMPMASLILPMTCCAHLYFALHSAKPTVGLVQVYLITLCVLSACSILATVVHSIPHPNHVVVYNFAIIGITYALYHFFEVPMWLTLPAAAVYSLLGVWLLQNVPVTFTMGEVVVVSQGLTILLIDTVIQLVSLYELFPLPKSLVFFRSESVLFVELLLVGVIFCCVMLSPALYKLTEAKQHHDRKFWSATFILMSLSIGFMLILPWLARLLGDHHPIPFLLFNCISTFQRVMLLLFWVVVCILTGVLVTAQSSSSAWAGPLKLDSDPMMQRKIFHIAGVVIYLVGILVDARFMALVSSNIFFLFVVVELCRAFNMWPFGEFLGQFFKRFLCKKDTGVAVVSNLYLLAGFCIPLWLSPLRSFNQAIRLTMYSGVLSLGIGDSVASIVGRRYGKMKWKGTDKTVLGSLAFVGSQLLTVGVLMIIDRHLGLLSGRQFLVYGLCVVMTAALEAYTWQIDNLVLPLLQHSLIITFMT